MVYGVFQSMGEFVRVRDSSRIPSSPPGKSALPLRLAEMNESTRGHHVDGKHLPYNPLGLALLSWKELGMCSVRAAEPLQGRCKFAARVQSSIIVEGACVAVFANLIAISLSQLLPNPGVWSPIGVLVKHFF